MYAYSVLLKGTTMCERVFHRGHSLSQCSLEWVFSTFFFLRVPPPHLPPNTASMLYKLHSPPVPQ